MCYALGVYAKYLQKSALEHFFQIELDFVSNRVGNENLIKSSQ